MEVVKARLDGTSARVARICLGLDFEIRGLYLIPMPNPPRVGDTTQLFHTACTCLPSSTTARLFNLYCQGLARSNFIIPFLSQSKESSRDFVMSGLKALFLLVMSKFPLQNCIFRYKTLGFGVCPFPKIRANNLYLRRKPPRQQGLGLSDTNLLTLAEVGAGTSRHSGHGSS